ncbi:MAG: hypothetical protein EB034_12470 [Verrucomicrobia bacterium]|nr:hypothetical protein [Verrucomicrobiota bacterium]
MGNIITQPTAPAFDTAKTSECWTKVCKLMEEWSEAVRAADRANPMPQFTGKLSETERSSRIELWGTRSRALQQTSGAFEYGLSHLPVVGIHKELTEHVKLLHSAIPIWTARFEAEQACISASQEVLRTLGGGKGYLLGAKIFFGAVGDFLLDKWNNPVAESDAFRNGRAETEKVPAKMRKIEEDFQQAHQRLMEKMQEITNANIKLRNSLSVELGTDLPPIEPLR